MMVSILKSSLVYRLPPSVGVHNTGCLLTFLRKWRLQICAEDGCLANLYLLATELRLACSAIGGGDSKVFATAIG